MSTQPTARRARFDANGRRIRRRRAARPVSLSPQREFAQSIDLTDSLVGARFSRRWPSPSPNQEADRPDTPLSDEDPDSEQAEPATPPPPLSPFNPLSPLPSPHEVPESPPPSPPTSPEIVSVVSDEATENDMPPGNAGPPAPVRNFARPQRVIAPQPVPSETRYVVECRRCGSRLCDECAYLWATSPDSGCFFSNWPHISYQVLRLPFQPRGYSRPPRPISTVTTGVIPPIVYSGYVHRHIRQPIIDRASELALRTVLDHVTTPAVATTYFDDMFIAASLAVINHAGHTLHTNVLVLSTHILNGSIAWSPGYPFGTPDSSRRPLPLLGEHFLDAQVNHRCVCDAFQRHGLIFSQLYSPFVSTECRVHLFILAQQTVCSHSFPP